MHPDSPLKQFRDVVRSTLDPAADDLPVTDFIITILASQYMTDFGDPLWGWIIGPPGSMKTEALRGLYEHPHIYMTSDLTPKSIISGYDREDGKDPSILPKLDGKVLVIKEFTSILQLPDVQTKQIFGTLRSCYDQQHGRATGTTGLKSYKSRFSMIAAVTPRIDAYTLVHADLGERFIACRIGRLGQSDRTERKRLARHIWNSTPHKKTWRATMTGVLHAAVDEFMNTDRVPPVFTDAQTEDIIEWADLIALMRTVPTEGAAAVEPELASRTVQQLRTLVEAHAFADRRSTITEDDLAFMRRIGRDTIPSAVSGMLSTLYRMQTTSMNGNYFELGQIARTSGGTVKWMYQAVRQYTYCDILTANNERIRLTDDFLERLRASNVFAGPRP